MKIAGIEVKPMFICRCGTKCESKASLLKHATEYHCLNAEELHTIKSTAFGDVEAWRKPEDFS